MKDTLQTCLRLKHEGYTASGIAKKMNVTESTAKKYIRKLEEEIGAEKLLDF